MPNGPADTLLKNGVFAIQSVVIYGQISVLPDRVLRRDADAPETLRVIRHIVKDTGIGFDQSESQHIPIEPAGLEEKAGTVHAAAEIQSFRRR